jgi:hypothetical protein
MNFEPPYDGDILKSFRTDDMWLQWPINYEMATIQVGVVVAAMGHRNIGHGSASDAACCLGIDDDISENMNFGVFVV